MKKPFDFAVTFDAFWLIMRGIVEFDCICGFESFFIYEHEINRFALDCR